MRSKVSVEQIRKDREAIIVHEIPYQVNKSTMVEKIAELVRDKRIEASPTCVTSPIATAFAW